METERVWNNFKEELLAFIQSRVKDQDLSKDILQEVFIKIHLNLKSLQSETKLASWLYQITRHTIIDHFRKVKHTNPLMDLPEEQNDPAVYLKFEKCILGFVDVLPDKYRDALRKTELGELSQKEYADQLGISYSGAKSRVQRAKEELKSLFVGCCGKKITSTTGKLDLKDPDECTC